MTYRWSLKTRLVGIFKERLVICLENPIVEWPEESWRAGPVPLWVCFVKLTSDEGQHHLWLQMRNDSSESPVPRRWISRVCLPGLGTLRLIGRK